MTVEDDPNDPVKMLLGVLRLDEGAARTEEDIFVGDSHPMPGGRIYGGQVVAQCVIAATRTVDADRPAHSLHGYFLRAGDVRLPTTFAVDRIHDGRSFARRRVQAYQDGVPIFSGIISFQQDDPGLSHQVEMPEVPAPEDIDASGTSPQDDARIMRRNPIEARRVPGPVLAEMSSQAPHQATWLRVKRDLGDDPRLQQAALAYMSDFTIQESSLRATGISWRTEGLKSASLDHAIWWHRAARADDWLLYVAESPVSRGGRGMNVGRLYSRDGALVASVAQEIMMRVPVSRDA